MCMGVRWWIIIFFPFAIEIVRSCCAYIQKLRCSVVSRGFHKVASRRGSRHRPSVCASPAARYTSAIEMSLNVNSGTRKSFRSESREREVDTNFSMTKHLGERSSTCVARGDLAHAEYELAICYGTAFLWHFNLLILLAGRHPPAPAFRNHGASASLPASYYRNCLALLPSNSNNSIFSPKRTSITINLATNEIRKYMFFRVVSPENFYDRNGFNSSNVAKPEITAPYFHKINSKLSIICICILRM